MNFAQIVVSSVEEIPQEPPVEFGQVLHLCLLLFAAFAATLVIMWVVMAVGRSARRRADKQGAGKATGWFGWGAETADTWRDGREVPAESGSPDGKDTDAESTESPQGSASGESASTDAGRSCNQ